MIKNKLLKVGKRHSAVVIEEHEHIEVVERFKYHGSLKSAGGKCNNVAKSRYDADLVRQRNYQRADNETSIR